ncbi:hypothetical protein NDU88_010019 [Pleurodeles waltl]|uniref:Uncharacterized protein n=1 Tax=Pleurodeles waltl TaxID=8319 RepID=A0AAV7PUS4_PLEWA|nr:hypothetical protein NDU88_010019 [Pleurodeles waltl]
MKIRSWSDGVRIRGFGGMALRAAVPGYVPIERVCSQRSTMELAKKFDYSVLIAPYGLIVHEERGSQAGAWRI